MAVDTCCVMNSTLTFLWRGFDLLHSTGTMWIVHYFLLPFSIQFLTFSLLYLRKTGWANQPSAPGVEAITSDEFPDDSAARIQKAHLVLTQLTGSGLMAMASLGLATGAGTESNTSSEYQHTVPQAAVLPSNAQIASVAEAAINAALGLDAKEEGKEQKDEDLQVGVSTSVKEVSGVLSEKILVHNVFDKDEETDEGWEEDIKEDFEEECSKYGTVKAVKVEHEKEGGMIYVSFEKKDEAKVCAEALSGRWFDKRQLRVEFVEGISEG